MDTQGDWSPAPEPDASAGGTLKIIDNGRYSNGGVDADKTSFLLLPRSQLGQLGCPNTCLSLLTTPASSAQDNLPLQREPSKAGTPSSQRCMTQVGTHPGLRLPRSGEATA